MVFPIAFTCQHLNTNQLQKPPLSYSQKNNLPYVFPLNVNVTFITKQAIQQLALETASTSIMNQDQSCKCQEVKVANRACQHTLELEVCTGHFYVVPAVRMKKKL